MVDVSESFINILRVAIFHVFVVINVAKWSDVPKNYAGHTNVDTCQLLMMIEFV